MATDHKLITVAILGGTGRLGPGLALRWARANYPVIIGSRSADRAQETAAEVNARLGIDTVRGLDNASAAREADIAVLTVAQAAHADALAALGDALQGKILVDATAQVDFKNPKPPTGTSAGRAAQQILGPDVRVVTAFQNVPAGALQDLGQELSSDVLVCSDDAEARTEVVRLAEAAGMRAYEAGGLDNALVVEGLAALLGSINRRYKSKSAGIRITGVAR